MIEVYHLKRPEEPGQAYFDLTGGFNRAAPNNPDPALRRLTDALWALGNDTDQVVITAPGEER